MKRIVKRLLLTAAAEGVAVTVAFVLIDVRDQRQEQRRRAEAAVEFEAVKQAVIRQIDLTPIINLP